MTPGRIIALIRDGVILCALAFLTWKIYQAGEDHVSGQNLKDLRTEMTAQGNTLKAWRQESTDANTKLNTDMAAIRAAAAQPVVHHWVCPQPTGSQPAVLPSAAGETGGAPAAAGGTEPGGGEVSEGSRRDQVVADFKAKLETWAAECRAEDDQWPK